MRLSRDHLASVAIHKHRVDIPPRRSVYKINPPFVTFYVLAPPGEKRDQDGGNISRTIGNPILITARLLP
ncbi:hypothetical protein PCA20602_03854 [Pandoraea capi]|uniref:Uncharacterized protein n=1 Tax=Pandoraea capi TaxID=2508286 RepID=A0ABY6W7A9_9BURK|nr:hypothetical protein PCA20602_03854 [Pandoraea capi]